MSSVLVTGGAGYIGSHTAVELIEAGREVIIADDLSNSEAAVIDRIATIAGTEPPFVEGDLSDPTVVGDLFSSYQIEAVVHFAAHKSVAESIEDPTGYYRNNLVSSLNLIDACTAHAVDQFVFSSSATVYGDPERNPIPETARLAPTNPYGWSKLMTEQMLRDAHRAHPGLRVALLRYFNPVGAHPSGLIGEDPSGTPNNLMPYLMRVAVGQLPQLNVFGDDYDTPDGSGIRDYIHVVDLSKGHLAALAALETGPHRFRAWNLGSGGGTSVFEMLRATSAAVGRDLPYKIVDRRPGDIAESRADPTRANAELDWRTERTLAEMCEDSWRWQRSNPSGYSSLSASGS